MGINLYSVREVAGRLKLTQVHVRRLCRGGLINGQKIGRDWVITDYSGYLRKKRKGNGNVE